MRKNLLKMFFICLMMGSFLAADAQFYPRKGWPKPSTTYMRASLEYAITNGWELSGDVLQAINPNFPNRSAGYIERVNNGGTMENQFTHLFLYTGQSNIPDSMARVDLTKSPPQINRIFVFKYDPNVAGRVIQTIEKTPANGFVDFARYVDSFDVSGKLIYTEIQKLPPVWAKEKEVHYIYNASGKLDSTITKEDNGDGVYIPKARSTFSYGADGNLTEEKIEEDFDGTWQDVARYRFTYTNSVEELVHAGKLEVYPNPCQDVLKVKLPEDVRNINAEVYNMVGQKVLSIAQTTELSSGTLDVNVSALPAGSYVLRCFNNTQVYTQLIHKN